MDIEYHVNHVQDICSPECIPPPSWSQVSGQLLDVVIEERNTLRTRLAAVEAESDKRFRTTLILAAQRDDAQNERDYALARLAAVEALCAQTGGGPDAWLYVIDVLAAARGEGDRV